MNDDALLDETLAAAANVAPPAPGPRRAAVLFIFITVLLDMISLGITIPVLPKLVDTFAGGHIDRAALLFGLFGLAWSLMQFVAAPILGVLSDRYGRRPVILLSNAGLAIDFAIMALAPNVGWLFAGRALSGITSAGSTTAGAYIADVTPPEKRAAAFGMLAAAFGIGFALGPALGGLLASFGPRVPFWAAAGLTLANASYGVFVLPESLAPEKRVPFTWARANPLGSLRLLRRHRELLGLVSSLFFSNLAVQSFGNVFVLYTIDRFAWNERTNGFALAGFGVFSILTSALLVGPVVKRFGDRFAVAAGFTLGIAGFALYALAGTGFWFLAALPLTGLWNLAGPPIQSRMSHLVDVTEQGALQGAIGCVRSIATILGPPIYTSLFAAVSTVGTYPLIGAPWFLGGLLLCAALAIGLRVVPARKPVAAQAIA